MSQSEREELKRYYNFNMPMLRLMGILAVAGIVVTIVLHHFF
jgi:hypothetical protein